MVRMSFFPYHKCRVVTKTSKEEIVKSLKGFVDLYGNGKLFSNKFYGEIEKDHFSIYKSSVFFNTTLVKINGKFFREEGGNTTIKMTFLLSEHVFVFFLLTLIFF